MNKMKVFVLLMFFFGFYACQSKSGKAIDNKEVADSAAIAVADEKTVVGVVEDASMNTFVLVTLNNDTVCVSTMDQDPDSVGGFMLGDTVRVNYIEEEEEPGVNLISTAKRVIVIGKKNSLK